jgi:hypothetical protein
MSQEMEEEMECLGMPHNTQVPRMNMDMEEEMRWVRIYPGINTPPEEEVEWVGLSHNSNNLMEKGWE